MQAQKQQSKRALKQESLSEKWLERWRRAGCAAPRPHASSSSLAGSGFCKETDRKHHQTLKE